MNEPLAWEALEYEYVERHPDWFWTLGIVALGGAVLALIFGNVLFALFIVLSGVILSLYAIKHPRMVRFEINDKGIVTDEVLYPYQTLQSFCIHEYRDSFRLLLKSQKLLMPHIIVPLNNVPPVAVRQAIGTKLPEIYEPESVSEKLMEHFGI